MQRLPRKVLMIVPAAALLLALAVMPGKPSAEARGTDKPDVSGGVGFFAPVVAWLEHANRRYQADVVGRLSTPVVAGTPAQSSVSAHLLSWFGIVSPPVAVADQHHNEALARFLSARERERSSHVKPDALVQIIARARPEAKVVTGQPTSPAGGNPSAPEHLAAAQQTSAFSPPSPSVPEMRVTQPRAPDASSVAKSIDRKRVDRKVTSAPRIERKRHAASNRTTAEAASSRVVRSTARAKNKRVRLAAHRQRLSKNHIHPRSGPVKTSATSCLFVTYAERGRVCVLKRGNRSLAASHRTSDRGHSVVGALRT